MPVVRSTRDRGLTLRMVLVMVYLAVVFTAAIVVMVVFLDGWGVLLAAVAVVALTGAWFTSGPRSMRAIGARLVSAETEPVLYGALERMCALSGMPTPKLAVMKAWDPNAFAYGRSPRQAVIVVTRPLIDLLEPHELEAVLAHELAHLAHRDLLVMSIASSPSILLTGLSAMLRDAGRRSAGLIMTAWLFVGVVSLLCFLPVRLLSRYRELCADGAAAALTQRPGSLASALQKITGAITPIPSTDLRSHAVIDTFGIVAAAGQESGGLTSTHPTLDRRMAQLARISSELSRP